MDSALLAGQVGVAGVSLGGFSALHDLLHAVKIGLTVWEQCTAFDADVEFFRARIILQQDILETWKRDWFDYSVGSIMSVGRASLVRQHEETIRKTLRSIDEEVVKLNPRSVLQPAQGDRTVFDKMKWIVGQREVAEASLEHVKTLLSGLLTLLPLQSINPEMKLVISALGNLASFNHSAEGLNLPQDAQTTLNRGFDLRTLRASLEKDLQRRTKEFQQSIPGHSMVIRSRPTELMIEEGTAGTRSRGLHEGNPVIVEWKSYVTWQGQKAILLRGRNDMLAQMLNATSKPEEMLTLHCKGYFDDIERSQYGFIFEYHAKPREVLTSLNQLFNKPPPEWLPTLHQRYQIAYSIGLTISILHAVGWLHKGIRSHNILVSRTQDSIYWARPYLCGFAYSRPDEPGELSEKLEHSERFNMYRHPAAQGQPSENYRQEYDIYSFGVLLFEIAIWSTAFPLWKQDPQLFRKELTSKTSQMKISHRLGTAYCELLMKCLDGFFEGKETSVAALFYSEAVEVLGRLLLT